MKLPSVEEEDAVIPSAWTSEDMPDRGTAVVRAISRTILARVPSSSCQPANSAKCQKPVSGSTETLPIVLGVM